MIWYKALSDLGAYCAGRSTLRVPFLALLALAALAGWCFGLFVWEPGGLYVDYGATRQSYTDGGGRTEPPDQNSW